MEVTGASDRVPREHDIAVRILEPDPQLAIRRVDLCALVDGAIDRDRDRGLVCELADEPDARVLELEAVVTTDERDVRIVLHCDVLEPHEPVG